MMSELPRPVVDSWHLRFGLLLAVLGFCIVLAVPFTVRNEFHTLTSIALTFLGGATAIFGVTVVSVPVASSLQAGTKR